METCFDRYDDYLKKKKKKQRKIWCPAHTEENREAILGKDYSRLEQRTRKVVRPCIHLNDLSPWRLVIMHNPFLPVYSAAFQFAGTN